MTSGSWPNTEPTHAQHNCHQAPTLRPSSPPPDPLHSASTCGPPSLSARSYSTTCSTVHRTPPPSTQPSSSSPPSPLRPGHLRQISLSQQLGLDPTQLTEQLLGRVQTWNDDPAGEAANALARRAQQSDHHPQTPAAAWIALADQVDPRLTSEPDWPALVNMLDSLHHGGTAVRPLVHEALAYGPLDDMPARDLRYRLAGLQQAPSNHYEDPEPSHKLTRREQESHPVIGRDRGESPSYGR